MATIKSYTDLEQSRKLTEILPLESADMYYREWKRMTKDIRIANVGSAGEKDLPCWSLSALLGVLPDHFYDKTGRKTLGMDKDNTRYNIFYENQYSYIQKTTDNPVDACYEMIIHLHELKML